MRRPVALLILATLLTAAVPLKAMHPPNQTRGFLPKAGFEHAGIDHVNLFNGGLTLTIPLGQRYPVGAEFSYGLQLVYNSQIWTYEQRWLDGELVTTASPDSASNAGLGWLLTLGRLLSPDDSGREKWTYVSPDGAEHTFYDEFGNFDDDDDPSAWYTRDGSYLRLIQPEESATERWVEFPGGDRHQFLKVLGQWRLKTMEDRFGNFLSITREAQGDDMTWTLTDNHERLHFVHLTEMSWIGRQVTQVDLEAFDGSRAQYDFSYSEVLVNRSCKDSDPENNDRIRLPHLVRIDLPDGSYYDMVGASGPDYYNVCFSGMDDVPGVLRGLRLPTGGRIEWGFEEYDYPPMQDIYDSSVGVATRSLLDRNGVELGTWTYERVNFTGPNGERERRTHLVTPSGTCSRHYFAQQYWLDAVERTGWEYGLPFSLSQDDGADLKVSGEIWTSSTSGGVCAGTKARSTYLKFEHDPLPVAAGPDNRMRWLDSNRRIAAAKTVYHDDGDRSVEARRSDFDGYGHYRTLTTTADFRSGSSKREERVATTNFLIGDPGDGVIPASDPWILDLFDYAEVTEDDATGEKASRVETTFDPQTGFLECRRILGSGVSRGAHDLLVVRQPDASGNVARIERHGGDLQTIDLDSDCDAGSDPEYSDLNTWDFGSQSQAQILKGDGEPMPFLSLDLDVDRSTGRARVSRDLAGLATEYSYDALGRRVQSTPEEGARRVTTYINAGGEEPARIHTAALSHEGATVLAESELQLDDLGRIWKRRRNMPGLGWVESEATLNAQGWTLAVSEPGVPDRRTEYLDYDAFGRPGTIRPPEGATHDLTFTYQGNRKVLTTRSVATSATAEEWVPRERLFDAYGRTRKVIEISAPGGLAVATRYLYDVGNRLTSIVTDVSQSDQDQRRLFSWDNRGFLLSEQHPEKGGGGNGTVQYGGFDSRGLVGAVVDGGTGLSMSYDAAGRLTAIDSGLSEGRPMKEFIYDLALGRGAGRVWKTVRHHWLSLPWRGGEEEDFTVVEEFEYQGATGQVSQRKTAVEPGGFSFVQGFEYNDLGYLSRLEYPVCSSTGCPTDAPDRSVETVFDLGYPVAVGDLAGPITYHPNGLAAEVEHSNGVSDRIEIDPDNPSRPLRLYSSGSVGGDWSSGALRYDGAGNIKSHLDGLPIVYDPVLRLTSIENLDDTRQSYDYDAFGNITAVTTSVGDQSSRRSAAVISTTNRLASASYDAAGNLVAWMGGGTYEYDELSRLKHQNGTEWTYLYTASGERTVSIHDLGDESSRTWKFTLRSRDNRVLREWLQTGAPEAENMAWQGDHVYRGGVLLATIDESGGVTHLHPNHLGTPTLSTDEEGNRVDLKWYHAYGEQIAGEMQSDEQMRFTGHEMDDHGHPTRDDLYYMHARYYSPFLGRFMRVDSDRGDPYLPQSLNRYAYVMGRPWIAVDPDGRSGALAVHATRVALAHTALGTLISSYADELGIPNGGAIGKLLGGTLILTGALVAAPATTGALATVALVVTVASGVDLVVDAVEELRLEEDSGPPDSEPPAPDEPPMPEEPLEDDPAPPMPPEPVLTFGGGRPGGMHLFNLPLGDSYWGGTAYFYMLLNPGVPSGVVEITDETFSCLNPDCEEPLAHTEKPGQ